MPKISVLIPREEIQAKTEELARRISEDYKGKDLLLVGVLKADSCLWLTFAEP